MKKFALNNSYFKNRYGEMPDTILEIARYQQIHGDLPFRYTGSNWVYDAFCERQKRKGVYASQYLTPDATVDRMLHFAGKYFNDLYVLEPCCGTGQITKGLVEANYSVMAFDIDAEMVELCNLLFPYIQVFRSDFRDFTRRPYNQIIANPPYEGPELTDFLQWILSVQTDSGVSILLLPAGFIDKTRPKALVAVLQQFYLLEREPMRESFERTNARAEIVVLKKR
jgi:SAM-dependent methyltransferase